MSLGPGRPPALPSRGSVIRSPCELLSMEPLFHPQSPRPSTIQRQAWPAPLTPAPVTLALAAVGLLVHLYWCTNIQTCIGLYLSQTASGNKFTASSTRLDLGREGGKAGWGRILGLVTRVCALRRMLMANFKGVSTQRHRNGGRGWPKAEISLLVKTLLLPALPLRRLRSGRPARLFPMESFFPSTLGPRMRTDPA